ncbi:methylmalonyl-CoA mutase family protein [Neobacillus citreus]|uniref:Acyl-CoA mutase large subunit family protein n=1 Tax=Neobacillus citreus TaxID=2833578 RepID=A0A942T706_9BACI|nr:methylmalonyl-CoA mutase family protein [Neobacillus citreus]MCH6264465.1 acyl-CoA mutase large subunit family protein [Neobacillus citreus]
MSKVIQKQELNEENQLFSEFPAASYREWRQAAEKTLKGASFEQKLISQTYEGIELQPMYFQEDIRDLSYLSSRPGSAPYVRGTRALGYQEKPWEVAQEHVYSTPSEFNEAAKHDLNRGQTMLNLVFDHASALGKDPDQALPENVGRGGVSISSLQDVNQALEGINLEQTPLFIQAGSVGFPVYCMLVAHARKMGMDSSRLHGCVGMDPLGTLVKEGTIPFSLRQAYDLMAELTFWAKHESPEMKTIQVQGESFHNAGANTVQELAFALAFGVEYIREMQQRGLSIDEIAPRMLFSFSIGSNFFMEIAKLRAARLLWSTIIDAFGGNQESQKMNIHARTSSWNKTVYDPYVNMLRGTAEAFAAIIAGVDSLHVSPFDEAVRPADEFSRRIARNTQIILEKEAHLAKVADPAGGSWYIESLTDSLAKQAWKQFQLVEEKGGMFKAVEKGYVQEQIKEIADRRFNNIGRRKDRFVGTNMYPNLMEQKLSESNLDWDSVYKSRCAAVGSHRRASGGAEKETLLLRLGTSQDGIVDTTINAIQAGVTVGEWVQAVKESSEIPPEIQALHLHRGAESFEALRKKADTHKEKNGSYPKVFLANLGPISQHKPRADFAKGFFEVGGFEVVTNKGFETVDLAVKAALETGASTVVICSSDAIYLELVPQLACELKQENPEITLFLAGLPDSETIELFKQAGVDQFVHLGSNCYNMLFDLQQRKGIGR